MLGIKIVVKADTKIVIYKLIVSIIIFYRCYLDMYYKLS